MSSEKSKKARSGATHTHTILCKDGGTRTLRVTRKLAMSLFCTECCGFESNPADCTSLLCPLYPFRTRTQLSLKGD